MPGFTWVSVRLGNPNRGGYDSVNRPHQNLFEAAKAAGYTGGPAIRDDRLQANLIYGYEKNLPALTPTDKGHYHPDSPEFWLVMAGQIRLRAGRPARVRGRRGRRGIRADGHVPPGALPRRGAVVPAGDHALHEQHAVDRALARWS